MLISERLSKVGNTISRVSSKTSDISHAVASPRRWTEAAKLSGKLIIMGIVIENKILYYKYSLDNEIITNQDFQDFRISRMSFKSCSRLG
ncbi:MULTISPECIES: hypothetical protein [Aphanizomenonaceae]|uniref:hypothetical protein n=1 Tax=Aphanizomenonaceae TaxID=1892259 RepID=UPI001D14F7AB|nr:MULTISPECIES: hypothetical protein [Aphanizomenonaceae]MDK2410549.1 hypothetical protein [Aphanizomenon sp. 202]MDK2459950.1 hypothetical protein [Aphanizomenon sp. PH219]